ncbi:lipase [Nocardia nova SH22a]|uniref:Lipase n=1 Tax=Nocardia nova SH22a TaxID=1415166 RepID=W5TCG1_9NOCA|nr:lipase family protein [Nocardia nova]AHH16932.1 lipase [Nocardia nova SH22a]
MKPAGSLTLIALSLVALLVPALLRPPVSSADNGPADDTTEWQRWIDHTIPPPSVPPAPAPPHTELAPDLAALWRATLSPPAGDPLFDEWPAGLDALHPGDPIQVRDVTATAALLAVVPIARAVQLKFRSTDATGAPSFGTATLLLPAANWTGPGTRPVLVNAIPINSLGLRCTPGYALAHGPHPKFSAGDLFPPTTAWALSHGYGVLVPDHEGPWMSYAEPRVAGHVVLDAIRAVRAVEPKTLGDSRFAIGGYSGGAIAAYAADMLLGEYAPELSGVLAGVSVGGLVTDYREVAHHFDGNIASGILMIVALAFAREHPELLGQVNNLGRWLATSPIKDTCGDSNGPLGVTGVPAEVAATSAHPLETPEANRIFDAADLRDRKSAAPLYIYHGGFDIWIPWRESRDLFGGQCEKGVPAVLRDVPGEHSIAMMSGFLGSMDWLDQRLRGVPAPDECPAPHR